ncbi:conjugal transfer protein TraF [Sphingobium sp. B11D3A]|uniref:conjugal transfer protein TraF n=1 Tax=Sphingobium sp. B11D3A TaxID=2940574 RepID=UPI002225450C|nr:conjugal transfer protein TraF [Sphingobium sp. B11D3A]MCW2393561.1 conjugal transfer pilus assembly protein TraF [Sphingobium sp. B11D3A]
MKTSKWLGVLALVSAMPLQAQTTEPAQALSSTPQDDLYCGQRKLGTWFYCERPKAQEPEQSAAPAMSAAQRLAMIREKLDEMKARAILEPTEENITAYVRFQREQLDRASTFSDQWQRSIWQNPELDYTLQRPVSTLGKRAWLDARKVDQDAALRNLSRRYGIFYFYAQNCGACEVFGPILKALADQSGFQVVAVSMDGGPNRSFPNYVVDVGQHQKMGLTSRATPALVLYDTQARRPIPIGTGILSADEITERIFTLTHTKVGSDF